MIDWSGFAHPKLPPATEAPAVVRAYVFDREHDTCRVCKRRRADSMHELIFRSQMGRVSRANSIAVCGSGTTGCHGFLQTHQIRFTFGTDTGAEGSIHFTTHTREAALWVKAA